MDNTEKLTTGGHTRRIRIQRNMCWNYYTQTNTNNVSKTWALLQTTGDKDESNIVLIRKS